MNTRSPGRQHADSLGGLGRPVPLEEHDRSCRKSAPATSDVRRRKPDVIPRLRPRRGSPGRRLSSSRPMATGTKTMQARANHATPSDRLTPPANVITSDADVEDGQPLATGQITVGEREGCEHVEETCQDPGRANRHSVT